MSALRFTSGTNHRNAWDDTNNGSNEQHDSQQEEAELVKRLPKDFPIDRFEAMNTKQQLNALKFSGLDEKEQWVLLNASAPLRDLKEYSQAQEEAETKAYVAKAIAPHAANPAQDSKNRVQTANSKPSNSAPLQNGAAQRKLEMRQGEYETRFLEKAAGRSANPVQASAAARSGSSGLSRERNTSASDAKKDTDTKASLWEQFTSFLRELFSPEEESESADSTPQVVTFQTVPPTVTPRMTPTPRPTSTLGLTERELRAKSAIDMAKKFADADIKYALGGGSPETGFDCSGLVEYISKNTKLKFGPGYLSKSAKYMVASFEEHPEFGTKVYDFSEHSALPELIAGDLVFSADSGSLNKDKHITMATGNNLQVIEASDMTGVNKVTYQFDAYATQKNGLYIRTSGQIVTYVIRPNY